MLTQSQSISPTKLLLLSASHQPVYLPSSTTYTPGVNGLEIDGLALGGLHVKEHYGSMEAQ